MNPSITILRVDASPRSSSLSRRLADVFVDAIEAPAKNLLRRDIAADPPPFIDADWAEAEFVPPGERDARLRTALAVSDVLVDEVEAADLIVISTPVYNFSVPASLKAWIDQIVRMWRTFEMGPDGPKGSLAGKRVVLVLTAGLRYGPGAPFAETGEQLVRTAFAFMGVTSINVVRVEGQLLGDGSTDVIRAEAELRLLASAFAGTAEISIEAPRA